MATDRRLTRRPLRLQARRLLVIGVLTICCGWAGAEGVAEAEPAPPLPIIVNLAAPADPDAIAEARERVLVRLRAEISAEELNAVTTFDQLPAIALSATAQVIFILLQMPEVASIERDPVFPPPQASPSTFSSGPASQ